LFEKAVEITANAVRGAMGGENSKEPKYAPTSSVRYGRR
jgi:hypothetical protein